MHSGGSILEHVTERKAEAQEVESLLGSHSDGTWGTSAVGPSLSRAAGTPWPLPRQNSCDYSYESSWQLLTICIQPFRARGLSASSGCTPSSSEGPWTQEGSPPPSGLRAGQGDVHWLALPLKATRGVLIWCYVNTRDPRRRRSSGLLTLLKVPQNRHEVGIPHGF